MACIFLNQNDGRVFLCIFGNYMFAVFLTTTSIDSVAVVALFCLICNFQADYKFLDNLSKFCTNDGQIHLIIIAF